MHALKIIALGAVVAVTPLLTTAQPSSLSGRTNSDYTVTLHYGTNIPLSKAVAEELESDVLELLRSANYNSRMPHRGVWQRPEAISEIARRYRELVAQGKYVLVVWPAPQKVQTVLGDVTTLELIVELEGNGVWMCSVDDEGRLVHLGKFRGDILVKMENLARKLAK